MGSVYLLGLSLRSVKRKWRDKIQPAAVERQLTIEKFQQESLLGKMCGISMVPGTKLFWVGVFLSRVLLVRGLMIDASRNQSGERKNSQKTNFHSHLKLISSDFCLDNYNNIDD